MSETIERADDLVDEASITDGRAVVRFTRTEAALADLREKYKDAIYDLTTTRGDTAARQARKELVSLRTGLERRRKELKAPATEFARKIDAEAARITAAIVALETPIDAQIRADEQRREEERLERIRSEEARQDAQRQRISDITNVAVRAVGLPSADIAEKIALVTRITIGDDYEEFAAAAINAKAETLLRLQELHAAALQAESVAAENERNRVRLAQLEAQAAELRKREDEERRAREAAEAAQREAEQKAARKRQEQGDAARALVDEIRTIQRRAVATSAAGMLELVTLVEAIKFGLEFGDFTGMVQKAKDDALADLHEMHAQKLHAELAHKRQQEELTAARAESERLAALAEQQRARIAEMHASQAGPASDGSQTPDGDEHGGSTAPAKAGSETPQEGANRDVSAEQSPGAEGSASPTGRGENVAPACGAAPVFIPNEPATISTGEIGRRLGFSLPATFILAELKIPNAGTDKRALLWRESQWREICAALAQHVTRVGGVQA